MSVVISDKAIVLTKYTSLIPVINDVFIKNNVTLAHEEKIFSSLEVFLDKINKEKNLTFLKKDILSFIKKNGYPVIIITDMTINTGLDSDHEYLKTLKTLLISFIIIIQSELFKNISCNILILADKKEYKSFIEHIKHPQKIIKTLKTNDERLNEIIQELAIDDEKYNKNFNILVTDAEQNESLIRSEMVLFLNMIKAKEKLKHKIPDKKYSEQAKPRISAAQAADVVFRSGELLFKNGDDPVSMDSDTALRDREIYILGNFTSFTRIEVIERIINMVKKDFCNEFGMENDDLIILNIPEGTIIDTTTPITLAQIMSKELHDYKNIRIKTTPSNYDIMRQSKGFNMIQKNVMLSDR